MEWPLLASLDADERTAFLATTRHRHYARGDVVVHEGDPSDSLHLVAAGRLAVQVTTAEGVSATLNILGPGDYFGELSLLGGRSPTRSASVVALEAAQTRSLSARAFRELRIRHRAADDVLLALLARRVEELSARLLEVMYDALDDRVHRLLAELARTYGDGSWAPVVVPLTQEDLAGLVGATRPSVNHVLQGLSSRGLVALGRGRITVLDPQALARLVP